MQKTNSPEREAVKSTLMLLVKQLINMTDEDKDLTVKDLQDIIKFYG